VITWLVLPAAASSLGYYRDPTVRGDTVVFVAEGDLWRVPLAGGIAARLTSHPGPESAPQLSPDGAWVAFAATYEGPREVYVMPVDGGPPTRLTWLGLGAEPVGWTPDGQVLVSTRATSELPVSRVLAVPRTGGPGTPLPLAEAANAAVAEDGSVWFTRYPFQGSWTRNYRGGTAQDVWLRRAGAAEATPFTTWEGTDRDPVLEGGRVYLLSDRDGAMNVWSYAPDGTDPRPITRATTLEVREFAVDAGRLVYRMGADLHVVDLATGAERPLDVRLDSDFDHTRERWVDDPLSWVTDAHLAPDGSKVVLTARGQAFVAPVGQGRLVTLAEDGVRYRDAHLLPDGGVAVLSDASGEVELWRLPGNGVGAPAAWTKGEARLKMATEPSPDGKRVAIVDKDQRLTVVEVATGKVTVVDESPIDRPGEPQWSADSRWLAWVSFAPNSNQVVKLWDHVSGEVLAATTDRYSSFSPTFSHDGRWLYFLSDRHFDSVVDHPWSSVWTEPFWDRPTVVMAVALQPGLRSPFAAQDELHTEPPPGEAEDEKEERRRRRKLSAGATEVAAEGLTARLIDVPVPPANAVQLRAGTDRLFWLERDAGGGAWRLVSAPIDREDVETTVLAEGVTGYELSADRKKVLVVTGDVVAVADASDDGPWDLDDAAVDLSTWRLRVLPREEWRQMFREAWRLERDYFYDRGMHGTDWPALLTRYEPLVDRVTDRAELGDLLSQLVAELQALHTFVYGGDLRYGDDDVAPASLGADLVREDAGWRVARVWPSDPDRPELRSPLAVLGQEVGAGELVTAIDGVSLAGGRDPGAALRGKAGAQVLLHVVGTPEKPRKPAPERDVVVVPLDPWAAWDRRYHAWELDRRQRVEQAGAGRLAYVHLRAMGSRDIDQWMREYSPVFDREGLIVDVRNNGGGNIDSWVLERLMRKAWMYWSQRVGDGPSWNMQRAFRGHLVVLVDAHTGSDGEAFAEGFRRLGLGKVIGTRTWGGEIWLSSSNVLVDGGIATAAEFGVYGPEGEWLIEGHGVEPDLVVDNLPVATFAGGDAQLDAAVAHLLQRLAEDPIERPTVPPHPDVTP
jgi:tricorn protease